MAVTAKCFIVCPQLARIGSKVTLKNMDKKAMSN